MCKRNARERVCSQTQMLFLRDTQAKDTRRNRGHGPKIISVCCSTWRDSLWESRQPTRRQTVEAAKYFSVLDIVLFFFRPNRVWTRVYKLSYIRSGRGYAVASSIGVSVLSSKLPLSFIATLARPTPDPPCRPLRGFSDKERRGSVICHKDKARRKKEWRG